jgi:hypothetical protein
VDGVLCLVEKQWDCPLQKLTAPLLAPEGAGGVEILGRLQLPGLVLQDLFIIYKSGKFTDLNSRC